MENPTRRQPRRCQAGYAPIRDYAILGDSRTAALIARDGSIDWLCLPNLDSPSVFAAILDTERGGCFRLAPEGPADVERRYLPETNVLETTWTTGDGVVRITDALTIPGAERQLVPFREIARRVEGLSGRVTLHWRVTPRFGFGGGRTEISRRRGVAVATSRADAIAVHSWNAGDTACDAQAIHGRFSIEAGRRALLALTAAHQEPMVFPLREEIESRLDHTIQFWRDWSAAGQYDGPWADAVRRSELALKLLVYAPSGAIAAAPTTSLPESPGGERNWDYRFCWIRDASFTLDAMLRLGRTEEARAFFWWFMQATRLTKPRLQVLYQLDGGGHAPERELPLRGYCGARPVRAGNLAAEQLQLDIYGVLFQTAWLYGTAGHHIDADTGRELAQVADLVSRIWREPDSGIWEVRSERQHFTESKVMCWVALDRAIRLNDAGILHGAHVKTWRREADAIRQFIETKCWSESMQSYARFAGSEDEVDASLLLMAIMSYHQSGDPRLMKTIAAVRHKLAHGPFLWRYAGEDGLSGSEGAFITCSFWLVEALARTGQHDEAARLMEELLAQANDVGLYAEEILPTSGAFLGNFPQGLVHLALVSAAVAFAEHRTA
jgi:GH15 family glucan-1,4-alpha-glucosidase